MGETIPFEVGCRRCEYLTKIGKRTFLCDQRVHLDNTDVVPIRDGVHTEDWYVCEGEDYKRAKLS